MTASEYGMVLTAVPTRAEGQRIARLLVDEKLAACVQLMPIESIYVWEGRTRDEAEVLLFVKTRGTLFEAAIARIKAVHSYAVPQIVALPFAAGLPAYLDWIGENTGG